MAKQRPSVQKRNREFAKRDRERKKREKAELKRQRREEGPVSDIYVEDGDVAELDPDGAPIERSSE